VRTTAPGPAAVPSLRACTLILGLAIILHRTEAFGTALKDFSVSSTRRFVHQPPRHILTTTTRLAFSMSSNEVSDKFQPPQHVVIAGAGIMGLSTAYYLATNHPLLPSSGRARTITVVDPTGTVAPAASGKAGGFLAQNWNDGGPTEELTRRSFELHRHLADALGPGTIQYRPLTCVSVSVDECESRRPSGKKLAGIEWAQSPEEDDAESRLTGVRVLGDEETIAQVHPKLLCERLWEETCRAVGKDTNARLVRGRVVAPVHDPNDRKLTGVRVVNSGIEGGDSETILPADALVLACGPWTTDRMQGIKYHSVVVPTPSVLTQCVFFSGHGDPEVYVRPDGTAYCTGFPEDARVVTERPGNEHVLPEKIDRILASVRKATGSSSVGALAADPVLRQACYLPTTRDGIPIMGAVPPTVAGGSAVYVCAGHTCWEILLGPASGEAMASLVATGGCATVDLRRFDPKRLGSFELLRNV
jgi:glycine/D-amino acid oxidase-like deaminating enzyme